MTRWRFRFSCRRACVAASCASFACSGTTFSPGSRSGAEREPVPRAREWTGSAVSRSVARVREAGDPKTRSSLFAFALVWLRRQLPTELSTVDLQFKT